MLKLLFPVIIIALLCSSCKKDGNSSSKNNWIVGTWKWTISVDTLYNGNKFVAIYTNDNAGPFSLKFNNDQTGQTSEPYAFTYSLTNLTLQLNKQILVQHIIKIDDTHIQITYHNDNGGGYNTGNNDAFVKE